MKVGPIQQWSALSQLFQCKVSKAKIQIKEQSGWCKELRETQVFRQAPQEGTWALEQRAQSTEVILKVNYVSENYLKAPQSNTRDFETMCFLMKSEFLFLEKVKWSIFYF